MRPAHSFSFVLLTPFVTLVAWLCLGVMVFVFRLWSPFAWVGLKFRPPRSGRPISADSSSASHTHSLLKQTGICILFLLAPIGRLVGPGHVQGHSFQ